MKKILLNTISYLFLMSFLFSYTGYLRQIEMSFCMDECSMFYLEDESGLHISNISFNNINPDLYINRYVELDGEEIWCVECGAIQVNEIYLSGSCENPVDCFVDPCLTAPDCEINTPVECNSNYCGGCYADFYDLDGNLVDCYANEIIGECYDIIGLNFGICDMYMGVAIVGGVCEGVSGCGWILDGVDYSNAFFNSFDECEQNCLDDLYTCEDIYNNYEELHTGINSECNFDNDCTAVWGHCDVGLGGCHYAVNVEEYPFYQINALVNDWDAYDCGGGVCDCMGLPNAVCNDGGCELAYCYEENPVGCFSSGCPEGYYCIDDPENCSPSSCFCDDNYWYGNWYCTEDCGGGSCIPILNGDVNYDGILNVADIIITVSMILGIIDFDFAADMNEDLAIDIIDVVTMISIILNE